MKLPYSEEEPSENFSEGSQTQKNKRESVRNNTLSEFISDSKTIILLAVILILIIVIVVLATFLWSGNRNKKDDFDNLVQEEVIHSIDQNENDENGTSDADDATCVSSAGSSAIVVSPGNTVPDITDNSVDNSAHYSTDYSEKDLEKDLAEEDESYSKEYILPELYAYYQADSQDAIYDLVKLRRYRKLSYSLKGTDQFYYYGETDENGNPNGLGLAIYADNAYYYGNFSHGEFEGNGTLQIYYVYGTEKASLKGSYSMHSYTGEWHNSLPNGDGHEHFDTEVDKFPADQEVYQNIIGHFTNGLYDGDMYATTVDFHGFVREWYGTAEDGVFELRSDMSSIGECPVWQNSQDENVFFHVMKKDNHDLGCSDLLSIHK